jgi:hypothetical protein
MPETSQAPAAAPDPIARIDAILAAEKPAPAKPAAQAAPAPEKVAEPEQPAEAQPEEEAQPNRVVEGEEAPQEDAPAAAEIPLDQLEGIELEVTVKGDDGKDVVEKPTVKELREGYMRQKDYSRKTAEVARQREEVGNQVRQAVESERGQYVKTLQELQSVILETVAPELKDVNWTTLATTDPFEYVRLDNRRKQITEVLSSLQQKQEETSKKQAEERKTEALKTAQKTLETLQADIPGWSPTLYQSLLKTGESLGYKHEEVANWTDARAIKLLHKANLYDQLKSEKPVTTNKANPPPRVVKAGAAQQNPGQQKHAEAMKRLQSNGSVENAADVIRARLGV